MKSWTTCRALAGPQEKQETDRREAPGQRNPRRRVGDEAAQRRKKAAFTDGGRDNAAVPASGEPPCQQRVKGGDCQDRACNPPGHPDPCDPDKENHESGNRELPALGAHPGAGHLRHRHIDGSMSGLPPLAHNLVADLGSGRTRERGGANEYEASNHRLGRDGTSLLISVIARSEATKQARAACAAPGCFASPQGREQDGLGGPGSRSRAPGMTRCVRACASRRGRDSTR